MLRIPWPRFTFTYQPISIRNFEIRHCNEVRVCLCYYTDITTHTRTNARTHTRGSKIFSKSKSLNLSCSGAQLQKSQNTHTYTRAPAH